MFLCILSLKYSNGLKQEKDSFYNRNCDWLSINLFKTKIGIDELRTKKIVRGINYTKNYHKTFVKKEFDTNQKIKSIS